MRRPSSMLFLAALTVLTAFTLPAVLAGHPESCMPPAGGGDDATIVVEPTAGVAHLPALPGCVEIPSGGSVTFVSVSLQLHDIESTFDQGRCFRSSADNGHELKPTNTHTVTLRYDAGLGLFRATDEGWLPCDGAVDWPNSDHAALVGYRCRIHQSFAGTIAVLPA